MQRSGNEELGACLAAAGVGLLSLDPAGVVRAGNAAAGALLRRSELAGRPLAALLATPGSRLAEGPFEAAVVDADGTRRELVLTVWPHADGAWCLVQDAEPLRAAPRRAALLQAVTSGLAQAVTAGDVAERTVGDLHDASGADASVVYVADAEGVMRLAASRGLDEPLASALAVLAPAAPYPLATAMRTGTPVWLPDRERLLAAYPNLARSSMLGRLHAVAALPLCVGDEVIGGVGLSFTEPRAFAAADRQAFECIARQAAQALSRSLLYQAERCARLDAQQKALVLETVRDSVVVTDMEGRVTWWNRGAEQLFGYPAAEVLGRSIAILTPGVDPTVTAARIAALRDEHERAGEWECRRRDGAPVWVDARMTLLTGEGGRPAGVVGVGKDVTERRRAERERVALLARERRRVEQLRGLAEAAHAINAALPVPDVLAAITARARSIIGAHVAVTTMSEGRAASATSLSEKYAAWSEALPGDGGFDAEVRETNRPLRLTEAEVRARGADADPPLRGLLAAPLVSRDGRNLGVVRLSDKADGDFTAEDEDILVQLAQMASVAVENALLLSLLQAEKERAERASRAKDEFLAMLGHELRNPLSPIVSALQVVKAQAPDAFPNERAIIERQVQHVVRLVDDLLDVSRITRGKIELERRRLELSEVVAQALEMSGPLFQQRGHHLRVDVPRRGLPVWGDAHRLAQVVANLLTNAAKYTDPGGHIEVYARNDGWRAVLRVRDDGIGIGPELLARVFDLFAQGERTLDRAQGGLGLGLAIVRSLVELHGGTVSATSDGPGKGSEFEVRLPLAAGEERRETAPRPATGPLAGPWVGRSILVVDDNQDAADMLAMLLGALGLRTQVAYDGPHALRVAEASPPEAVLVDIGLPVMDGYELGGRLRERWPAMRVVALTGYGQDADRHRSLEAGFEDHLVKPVALDDLRHVLRRVFESRA
jgi:PAS domain S-box-containing protein